MLSTEYEPPKVDKAEHYEAWLQKHFPNVATSPLGNRHRSLWEWFGDLEAGVRVEPRIEIWPRGGAKSSTGELGCTFVGAKGARKFCLYVCETQDQADKHVQAVSTLLEKLGYGPALNKMGHSKGWRRQQLRANNGYNVAGIGLDVASRGIKLDQFRPDLIIFDDIDNREDNPKKTKKKEHAITQSILPAGSLEVATLFLQNLIIEDGIVSRLAAGRADYLLSAAINGPEPAILDLKVENATLWNGKNYKKIISGVATWAGQNLQTCQQQILDWGWTSFKRESQHEVFGSDGLFFDHHAFQYIKAEDLPEDLTICRAWDLGATQDGGDPTAGVLLGIAPNKRVYIIDVKREFYASNDVRRLIRRTAEGDRAGIVYGPDEKKDSGAFDKAGPELFRFKYKGRAKLHLPQDPGQAGKDQAGQVEEQFKEFHPVIETVSGSKATRASGLQEQVNEGNVYLVEGDWNHGFVEEARQFREDEEHDWDDRIDAGADSYNEIKTPSDSKAVATPPALRIVSVARKN